MSKNTDTNLKVDEFKSSLNDISEQLNLIGKDIISKTSDKRGLTEAYGWNHPAITIDDLANLAFDLSIKIKSVEILPDNDLDIMKIDDIAYNLSILKINTIPQMFNAGNSPMAIYSYISSINIIEQILQPLWDWRTSDDHKMMPSHLFKRLSSLKGQLQSISIDKEKLTKQIDLIQSAYDAADSLPADMQTLRDIRKELSEISVQSNTLLERIKDNKKETESYHHEAKANKETTDKLVSNCEDAYRITTTKGLAASFEQKAASLNWSIRLWVVGLLFSLLVGAFIGRDRLEILNSVLSDPSLDSVHIIIQVVLSILSLGAPLWFAWLSTKQIGQRFKLSEDYSYKASIAKSYEGYRKEAARIDSEFEHRLFGTALTRVEEPPLRLVDIQTHSSPWQEFFESDVFKKALDKFPDLRRTYNRISPQKNKPSKVDTSVEAPLQKVDDDAA